MSNGSAQDESSIDNGILFLNLYMSRDETGTESMSMINKIWSEGQLKERPGDSQNRVNILTCEFLTEKKKLIKTVYVDNPLFALSESFDANGTIQREGKGLQEAPLMIRTEVAKNVAFIQIRNSSNDSTHLIDLQ